LLSEKLLLIKSACEEYDENSADDILAELNKMNWGSREKELLAKLAEYLLHSDFDDAVEAVSQYLT
jgi:hypothetical protein